METSLYVAKLTRELSEREQEILWGALPPERQERLARLKAPSGRPEVLCAYGLLLLALRLKLGGGSLPEVALSDNGKPYFPAFPGAQFSISHTDGAVMVGLSDAPIGVDIEKARPAPPRLMRRVAGADSPDAFFRAWVRAEAIGKRDGRGVVPVLRGGAPGAGYSPVETFPGYYAAAAVAPGREIKETRLFVV
ncbi:MAG: 4'-phosphopantetheinyl transferase [Oscillibacter sp.]|nr:4'-phosphopantetheinyl transferase [Oscillibacter sp.]